LLESIIFIFGLIIGSFLNVCIYRLPTGDSLFRLPFHCTKSCCRDNETLFLVRCVAVQCLTGVLFVCWFTVIGIRTELFKMFIFTAFLILITFIDYDHQLILDKVLVAFAGVGVLINLFYAYIPINMFVAKISITNMLIGAVGGGSLLLLITIVSRGGMGGGDIKFVTALGLWMGWEATLMALLLSFIFGGVVSFILLVFKVKGRKDFIPFGPFIASGALLAMYMVFYIRNSGVIT
jgi:leader peptidase (prepilin peptidase)/N-methyltransferase